MTSRSSASTRVLIIDDDEKLSALLMEYLTQFGFSVRAVPEPESGLRALKHDPPDIVILDVMLPDMDGFSVCRKVRESSRVPIVMLTARGDVMDRIVGLELGAEDRACRRARSELVDARRESRRPGAGAHHRGVRAAWVARAQPGTRVEPRAHHG